MKRSDRLNTKPKIDSRKGYYVTVLCHAPHFTDTGFNTDILASDVVMWGFSEDEVRDNAQALVPPMVDPSLIEIVVDRI
jgi:hypothetical protein